jgi:hypothetical protein
LKAFVGEIYTNGEVEDLRSVWFHGMFDQITAVYQAGFVDDRTMAGQLKWGEELVCHKRMKGVNPKGFNGTSDEDTDSDEDFEDVFEEEEDEERTEEEDMNYLCEEEIDEDYQIDVEEIIRADDDNWNYEVVEKLQVEWYRKTRISRL